VKIRDGFSIGIQKLPALDATATGWDVGPKKRNGCAGANGAKESGEDAGGGEGCRRCAEDGGDGVPGADGEDEGARAPKSRSLPPCGEKPNPAGEDGPVATPPGDAAGDGASSASKLLDVFPRTRDRACCAVRRVLRAPIGEDAAVAPPPPPAGGFLR
jgi:hypothetical protein